MSPIVIYLLIIFFITDVGGLGCLQVICPESPQTTENEIVGCSSDGYCGSYRNLRRNQQLVEAVDLKCREGNNVYAPFDGEIVYYQPLGNNIADDRCGSNHGVQINGHGQWRGYTVLIGTVKLLKFGGIVRAGEKIGLAGNLDCAQFSGYPYDNFIRFHLFRQGKPIDPTSHLIDCMCTGQICETNKNNAHIGIPFKFDGRYNGIRGWELKCSDVVVSDESGFDEDDETDREQIAPKIYSPIDGNIIGRIRLEHIHGRSYSGCSNEGIFIMGTDKWMDYEVRIYNARFRENFGLGQQHILQGRHIGYRLTCDGSPQSIFLEVRFQGALVDISEALNASNCKHNKKFNRLF